MRARETERAALAAQHNASVEPDGPRLLPLCLELQVAIVNKAPSDRCECRYLGHGKGRRGVSFARPTRVSDAGNQTFPALSGLPSRSHAR